MRAVIIYYAGSGETAALAGRVGKGLCCDSIGILEPAEDGAPSPFADSILDLSCYGAVLLGFPAAGRRIPYAMESFVRSRDLSGKTVIPFVPYRGIGFRRALSRLRRLCPGARVTLPYGSRRGRQDGFEGWLGSVRSLLSDGGEEECGAKSAAREKDM